MNAIKSKESFFEKCLCDVLMLRTNRNIERGKKDFGESRPMMGFLFTLSAPHEKTCVQMYQAFREKMKMTLLYYSVEVARYVAASCPEEGFWKRMLF